MFGNQGIRLIRLSHTAGESNKAGFTSTITLQSFAFFIAESELFSEWTWRDCRLPANRLYAYAFLYLYNWQKCQK